MTRLSHLVAGTLGVVATIALMVGAYMLTPFGSEKIVINPYDAVGAVCAVSFCFLFIKVGLPLIDRLIRKTS